jgi:hypothetical protein
MPADVRRQTDKEIRAILKEGYREEFKLKYGLDDQDIQDFGGDSEHSWMTTVQDLSGRINKIVVSRGMTGWPDIHFGVLPIGTLDAVALRVPESSDNLIVFNEGMFLFLYLFTKIVIVAAAEPTVTDERGTIHFVVSAFIKNKLKDLFGEYLLKGWP